MNSLPILRLAAAILFVAAIRALASPLIENGLDAVGTDLRLRLDDSAQERSTTSINWLDLRSVRPVVGVVEIAEPAAGPVDLAWKILIDPGHGGEDYGAVTPGRLMEKDVALRISKLVRQELASQARKKGIEVDLRLTREDDTFVPLRDRPDIANQWDADLFVSIHLNSSPVPKVRGFEVYFLSPQGSDADATRVARLENSVERAPASADVRAILSDVQTNMHIAESAGFAETVFSSMSVEFLPNKRGVRQAPFAVLSGTTMPALLIEVAYLTHAGEVENLKRGIYLKRVAGAISSGILKFAQSRKKKPGVPYENRRQAAR